MKTSTLWVLVAVVSGSVFAQTSAPSIGNLQPRPAEIAPNAAKNLMLGIVRTGDQLVAVGDRGTILLSTDAENWEQVPVPAHPTLTAVSFADAKNGWAVGHDATILRTTDAGRTWKLQNFSAKDSKPVLGILAVDAQNAYAVGAYGLFLNTFDGGIIWTPVAAPAILQDGPHLNALIKLNNGDLFLVGESGLIGVQDSGQTWRRLKLPYDGSLFGALPRGDRGALVYGLRGNVYVTSDVRSGQWTQINTGTVQSLFGGALLSNGEAVLVGADGAVLIVGTDNKVRRAGSTDGQNEVSAGYAAVLPWKNELLVVSELGITRLANPAR